MSRLSWPCKIFIIAESFFGIRINRNIDLITNTVAVVYHLNLDIWVVLSEVACERCCIKFFSGFNISQIQSNICTHIWAWQEQKNFYEPKWPWGFNTADSPWYINIYTHMLNIPNPNFSHISSPKCLLLSFDKQECIESLMPSQAAYCHRFKAVFVQRIGTYMYWIFDCVSVGMTLAGSLKCYCLWELSNKTHPNRYFWQCCAV